MAGNILVVHEYFDAGHPSFLTELRSTCAPKKIRAFAEKWYADPRPWAREQLHAYLDQPFNCVGHEPLIKKLFKLAEAAGDDATMGRFLVALDRAVRRNEWRRIEPSAFLFSLATRRYLRRRAWRYFRRIGFRDPARYRAAVRKILPLYREEDCDSGVHLLDNWGLVHILFHRSTVLRAQTTGWFVREGLALRDLRVAPMFPVDVLEILVAANARPIRRAMMQCLPETAPFEIVLRLLEHDDGEMQELGLRFFPTTQVPSDAWERLLRIRNVEVLEAICERVPKDQPVDRLFEFAKSPLGPLARLGVDGLANAPAPRERFLDLAQVRVPTVAADAVALARERLTPAQPDEILAFLDARLKAVRDAAWEWFAESPSSPESWAKLAESPYDDIRFALLRHLERGNEQLWASVLLNIHRGNRVKRIAIAQVAREAERDPKYLPLLAVAARSVRAPEFRAGLAAVVRVARTHPDLVARHFPELRLAP